MLFPSPDPDTLYDALIARDPSYEGRAYVGVTSTGIFCRLTCPARKPKRENTVFHETAAQCMEAGFRPCKRCRPLDRPEDPDLMALISALDADPTRLWSETEIRNRGFDPSTIRRKSKRAYGMTFLDMARLARIRAGARAVSEGSTVIEAQLDAGFESGSGFRKAFSKLLGHPPSALVPDAPLKADWIPTPLGPMIVVAGAHTLQLLEFHDRKMLPRSLNKLQDANRCAIAVGRTPAIEAVAMQIDEYFAGERMVFDLPLAQPGSAFARAVWTELRAIPPGTTTTYGALAAKLGRPTASRAIARANGANTLAIIVPCHRVIGADGALTGYGGGLWRKKALLDLERQHTR